MDAKQAYIHAEEMFAASKKYTDSQMIGAGNVTGVKGDAEESFRAGTVNLTPANIGAYSKSETDAKLDGLETKIERLIPQVAPKYGVAGIGQSASALRRLGDAIGLTAQVGTDGDNLSVINDFDNLNPWKRRKCVGDWSLNEQGKAVFNVRAYLGDTNYTEDGTMGDYVAVECPLCYFKLSGNELWISEFKADEEYHPFGIFKIGNSETNLLQKYYLPAYALALDSNGYAVSLPGLANEQGDYASLYNKARTYKNGLLGTQSNLQQAAVNFYEWALFTVEFAQQNCQNVMQGCCNLRSADADKCTFIDETHVLLNNYNAARVINEFVCISNSTSHTDVRYKATHKIVSIVRCDETGTADASGTYSLIEVEDLGTGYFDYDLTGATEYQFAARPWMTGSCNNVSTPSGSPVSNSNGYYPMKYRWRENVYSNQYKTMADLFDILVTDSDNENMLEWYLCPDPTKIASPVTNIPNSAAGQNVLKSEPYVKLSVETAHENYVNGYIKSKKYDPNYPDIWIPFETTGGSASTYFAAYAYLVYSNLVRSVRFGGSWFFGASDGFSSVYANIAPSLGSAFYGGDLCINQA